MRGCGEVKQMHALVSVTKELTNTSTSTRTQSVQVERGLGRHAVPSQGCEQP